jgi:hypothetical protein
MERDGKSRRGAENMQREVVPKLTRAWALGRRKEEERSEDTSDALRSRDGYVRMIEGTAHMRYNEGLYG